MGDGHQLHALVVEQFLQGIDGQLAVLVVGHHDDLDILAASDVQEGDDVAGVLGGGGEDAVAGPERGGQPVERQVPAAGGVLDVGDLVRGAAQQRGRGAVEAFDLRLGTGRGLVPTDVGLEPEVGDDGVEHGAGGNADPA